MRPMKDLTEGLDSKPRKIPSKYFYDDQGSRLFAHITELEEYYPTRCEQEILLEQSQKLLGSIDGVELNIVELGAGDGRKIGPLLEAALKKFTHVTYKPIDISMQALKDVRLRLREEIPGLKVEPCLLDMEKNLAGLPLNRSCANLILFLGSTIGNFTPPQQRKFLGDVRSIMHPGDFLCVGFDLKKDPHILIKAYDDSEGVTREFNLNLLRRFNRELGADFDEDAFEHLAAYNPATGSMESWLVSQKEQTVNLPKLHRTLHLDAFEGIQVETSWKFSRREIASLAKATGFKQVQSLFDHEGWFVDELWT
ncbi:MAG: L-histidine N(alpha)-methyltransferase [Bdellovibrionales bacterium]